MATHALEAEHVGLRRVSPMRPLSWLRAGWNELLTHKAASLAYGAMVSVLGALILAYNQHPVYIGAVTAGFLFVGPLLTAGLCELSRAREAGEPVTFGDSLSVLQTRRDNLVGFARGLLLVMAAWFLFSGLFYFPIAGSIVPSLEKAAWGDVLRLVSDLQLAAYLAIALVLSGAVFALSVVSVPLIVDRDASPGAAMTISLKVVSSNLPAMVLWSLLILALVAVGFATSLVAMIVLFPLLGHATWRAYRELVER